MSILGHMGCDVPQGSENLAQGSILPGEDLVFVGGRQRAILEHRQSVKRPDFDECSDEKWGCL